MQPLQDEPKAEKEAAVPNCPKCGDNRQVWKNQISGKWTCHRAFCDTVIEEQVTARGAVPADWLAAVQEFVDRCEAGEVRSIRTYAKFKALLSAAPKQVAQPVQPLAEANNYIQSVPNHCDRIVWRGQYYHLPLPLSQAKPEQAAAAPQKPKD